MRHCVARFRSSVVCSMLCCYCCQIGYCVEVADQVHPRSWESLLKFMPRECDTVILCGRLPSATGKNRDSCPGIGKCEGSLLSYLPDDLKSTVSLLSSNGIVFGARSATKARERDTGKNTSIGWIGLIAIDSEKPSNVESVKRKIAAIPQDPLAAPAKDDRVIARTCTAADASKSHMNIAMIGSEYLVLGTDAHAFHGVVNRITGINAEEAKYNGPIVLQEQMENPNDFVLIVRRGILLESLGASHFALAFDEEHMEYLVDVQYDNYTEDHLSQLKHWMLQRLPFAAREKVDKSLHIKMARKGSVQIRISAKSPDADYMMYLIRPVPS